MRAAWSPVRRVLNQDRLPIFLLRPKAAKMGDREVLYLLIAAIDWPLVRCRRGRHTPLRSVSSLSLSQVGEGNSRLSREQRGPSCGRPSLISSSPLLCTTTTPLPHHHSGSTHSKRPDVIFHSFMLLSWVIHHSYLFWIAPLPSTHRHCPSPSG